MQTEKITADAVPSVSVGRANGRVEKCEAHGTYSVECIGPDGNVKWSEEFDNLVTTAGKNAALNAFLEGSGYSVVGPYIGLINGSASSASITDTMSAHAAWLEVGGANAPTYTGTRKTALWLMAAAGEKELSAPASFGITSSGTVGGCFLVFGTGASNAIGNTSGVLYSAGAFTGGSRAVDNLDTLNVSYKAQL